MIMYFSRVHRAHTPVTGLKGFALPAIFQLKSVFSLFSFHTYWLRVVSLLNFSWVKDLVWFLNLSLNWVEVIPV